MRLGVRPPKGSLLTQAHTTPVLQAALNLPLLYYAHLLPDSLSVFVTVPPTPQCPV